MLVVASSNSVRDLDLAPIVPIRTVANRGLAGIDGTLSTAVGAALANGGATYALVGDLAFLHDYNALVIGPDEPRPDLPHRGDERQRRRHLLHPRTGRRPRLRTRLRHPHNTDLAALCAATHTPYHLAETPDALRAALARTVAGLIGILGLRSSITTAARAVRIALLAVVLLGPTAHDW